MRVPRVHVPELREGELRLVGRPAHHLRDVLRVTRGAVVRGFDGEGREAEGQVHDVDADAVVVGFAPPAPSTREPDLRLTLAVALLKGDKLGDVVRRGTELGAARFLLFRSRHGDVPDLSAPKLARFRRIAAEAARQCGRSVVPEVEPPVPLARVELAGLALVASPDADATLNDALRDRDPADVTVVTGPEGGLAADEVGALADRGAVPVRLGPRILRAETAPVAVAAALLLPGAR